MRKFTAAFYASDWFVLLVMGTILAISMAGVHTYWEHRLQEDRKARITFQFDTDH